MTCSHAWIYRNGRSQCRKCGAWAADLRCMPAFRQQGGRYPTLTDLQNYVCAVRSRYSGESCGANIRARTLDGELRALCDNGHDVVIAGRIARKSSRDHVYRQQESDALEVLDGLPPELRALARKEELTCR